MFVGIFGIMLYQNTTESNNVNGSKGFADLTDFQLKHQMWWTPEDMKKFAEVMNVRPELLIFSSFVGRSTTLLPFRRLGSEEGRQMACLHCLSYGQTN